MQWAILTAAVLLLIGFVLRARLRVLQLLFIPASVIGGLVGLIAVQVALQSELTAAPAAAIIDTLRTWPGALIAVVFAGLLLEPRPERRVGSALRGAALCGIMVWIIVLGQVAFGLVATRYLVMPSHEVPAAFGQLIEAGFAGGHATAAALGTLYTEALDFPVGLDLGLFMATVGLVFSVVSGIVLVNVGVRLGWTRSGRAEVRLISGLEARQDRAPAAFARVRSEVIDPLAFQLVLVAMAFLLGALLRWGFIELVRLLEPGEAMQYVDNLPLFLFTLLGGWFLRSAMRALGIEDLIDEASIKRIVAIAMEFLIVAAIASLRIDVVAAYAGPLALLCLVGFTWAIFCLVGLSPLLLPREHWFELGLINYGMSTGTTAQGIMLLRIVDRDLESGAAEDYALAAPLSAPFIGGGVLTMTLPLLLVKLPMVTIAGVMGAVMIVLIVAGRLLRGPGAAR